MPTSVNKWLNEEVVNLKGNSRLEHIFSKCFANVVGNKKVKEAYYHIILTLNIVFCRCEDFPP